MLGAFKRGDADWLSFFMFTYFTDRDGKMQLHSLAQSGFDPLSRTCRFMLTEEAHHMFVGETGISRVVQRTCEAMKKPASAIPTISPKGARARGDRSADHPEEVEPALLAVAGSVRVRSLDPMRRTPSTPASRAATRKPRSTTITGMQNSTYPVLKLINGEGQAGR